MKKGNVCLFIAVVLMVLAIATNPTRSEYISWLKDKAIESPHTRLDKGIVTLVGEKALNTKTTTKDYGLFTVYVTSTKKDSMVALGVFNHFIPIDM
ncbi:hypothetical protein JOD45_000288 [Scopulibacillus daqui]|uniref:DUF4359 domain-containing protein n=1 Tax=Scopulibacillus daqui TaxID=1469162 RepID=A0ABS2PVM1_9BACL|nr:hypothetical protein [Scopulibacillus daqui]MBM7644097.1 hypothetical protein [Scopulibacillus daqui]